MADYPQRMPYVLVNGVKIHYVEKGTGSPIVLLNGFGGTVDYFSEIMEMMSENHRMITYELRGAGESHCETDFAGDDLVEDLKQLLAYLKIEKFHLYGTSMGSQIAAMFAMRYPEMVKSLTLVSTFEHRPARSSFLLKTMSESVEKGGDPKYLFDVVRAMSMTEKSFVNMEETGRKLSETRIVTKGMFNLAASMDKIDLHGKLDRIKAPTLVIHGEEDIMVPPRFGEAMAKGIKGSRLVTVPGAGHTIRAKLYVQEFEKHVAENE